MQNSKLIQLLQTFSAAEWRSFQDFVHSPYYNKHEDTARLLDYLKKGAPDLREDHIGRPLVYRQLFPGEAYDERRLNRLMSKLLKLAEQFLGIQRFGECSRRCVSRGGAEGAKALFSACSRIAENQFDTVV